MSDASPPLVLTYAPPADRGSPPKRRWWLHLGVLLPALVVPYVNFTFGTSPVGALVNGRPASTDDLFLFVLALAFFIAFPLIAWKLRSLLHPDPPGPLERLGGWFIAILCAAIPGTTLTLLSKDASSSLRPPVTGDDILGWVILGGGFAILGLGFWHAIRSRGDRRRGIDALLSSAYLTNAWVCLIGFHDDPELGYWLTLVPAAALLCELISRSFRRGNAL